MSKKKIATLRSFADQTDNQKAIKKRDLEKEYQAFKLYVMVKNAMQARNTPANKFTC